MDRPKLKLKEPPSNPNESMEWLQNHRFARPKPPSVLDRLGGTFKRVLRVVLLLAVLVAVFLLIPFRLWDDYAVWRQLKDDLAQLESTPDALPALQRALSTAGEAGLLWSQPSGACPEKWYQRARQRRYEASYGVIQTLALGTIKQGRTDRGINELEDLKQRTGLSALPFLPDTGKLVTTCTQCEKGKLSKKCAECRGQLQCKRCSGKGYTTLSKSPSTTLRDTASSSRKARRLGDPSFIKKVQTVRQSCSACNGTGKCPVCRGTGGRESACPTCRGQIRIIDFPSLPKLYEGSLAGTLKLVQDDLAIRQVIHSLANAQRALLLKGKTAGLDLMSAANIDIDFGGGEEAPPAQPHKDDATQPEEPARVSVTQDPLEARLQKACETLLQTPLSLPDLATLAEVSRAATNSPALQSRAMAAFSLAHLIQGNTNNFARALQIQRTTFPGEAALITLTPEDYTATCDVCQGKGDKVTPCPSCMGPKKCQACNGAGKKAAGDGFVPCDACKDRGLCAMCKGLRHMTIACSACKGSGKLFHVKDAVRNNYNALLTNMVALCRENLLFSEQLAKAEAEKHGLARVGMLQSITNRFPNRPELPRVTALLDASLKERDLKAKERADPEVQSRQRKEVEELLKLERATNIEGAVSAIRAYVAGHPDTPALEELQGVVDTLIEKQRRKHKNVKIATGAGLLVGLAVLCLAARPLLKKRRPQRLNALPGMRNINTDDFTDPLALTAKDSRDRANAKTD